MAYVRSFLIFFFLFKSINSFSVYKKLPEVYGENERSHLNFPHINKICKNRDEVCKSNDTAVCTVRIIKGKVQYEKFKNSCYLFLNNMCDYPGEEFHIMTGISCETNLRRMDQRRNNANATHENVTDTFPVEDGSVTPVGDVGNVTRPHTDAPILRSNTVSRIYDLDTAFDFHACPLNCPDTYSPVCVSANRGEGKYFKFFTFINHCQGDVYYCKNYNEFAPPPDMDEEDVNSSGLSWSYCGAFRYMQFARFSEVLASMGHYGWLSGHQRYSAIIEPHQRAPGYG